MRRSFATLSMSPSKRMTKGRRIGSRRKQIPFGNDNKGGGGPFDRRRCCKSGRGDAARGGAGEGISGGGGGGCRADGRRGGAVSRIELCGEGRRAAAGEPGAGAGYRAEASVS